jgi:Holliday junction resolvase
MSKLSRNKGARGEREFLKLITKLLSDRGIKVELRRNYDQTAIGGADCLKLPGVAIEVKRQEKLELSKWWRQAIDQSLRCDALPVLAYRQNRNQWEIFVPAETKPNYLRSHVFQERTGLPKAAILSPEEFADFYVKRSERSQ